MVMAWILQCILWVSLFQVSTHSAELWAARSVREGERANGYKPNGSYKILNRLVKPLISTRRRGESSLVFPDPTGSGDELTPIIPDDCQRIGICDNVPNYPEDLVANILRDMELHNLTKFNKDVLEQPQIAERIGPEEENVELCPSVERIYAPRAAQDANKEWHVIVNDKAKPQQTFRVEICSSKESSCLPIAYFQNGYQARCIQKYMLRQMVAINEKKEVVERPFQVPSCCSCVAKVV